MATAERLVTLAKSMVAPGRLCLGSLGHDPIPLYSEALDVAVLWNAKAGCTFAVKWLFYQEDLLDEALAYSRWPHDYRQQVYCRRPMYSEGIKRIPALGPRVIKFVRNPFDRAVGGYLFFSHWAQRADEGQHAVVLTAIGRHVGRDVSAGEGFSFREYVGYLSTLDLDDTDPHVRHQMSTCERLGRLPELTILRIEESEAAIPRLEAKLGLRRSDPARLSRSRHNTVREEADGFVGDVRLERTLNATVPRSHSFYDAALEAEVGRLYAEDVVAYGYDVDSPRG